MGVVVKTVRSIRNTLAALVVIGLGVAGATTTATAAEVDEATGASVQMQAVKLTADSATAYGYDVRTDADGRQWASDASAPEGDFSHAVLIPEDTDASARGIVNGNCGSAWVFFNSKISIRTGYTIATPWGAPVSQTWPVAIKSSIDFESYDFSGLAAWGSQTWEATRAISTQALNGQELEALAGGSVLTSNGSICISGSPTASIIW